MQKVPLTPSGRRKVHTKLIHKSSENTNLSLLNWLLKCNATLTNQDLDLCVNIRICELIDHHVQYHEKGRTKA